MSMHGRQNSRQKLLENCVELMVTGMGEDLCAKHDILSGCVTQPFSDARENARVCPGVATPLLHFCTPQSVTKFDSLHLEIHCFLPL